MGSPLGAWSALQGRALQADQSKPVQDLVQSLIGIQDRRDQKARLKEASERQQQLLELQQQQAKQAEEWKLYEAQKELDARTKAFEKVPVEIIKQIGQLEMGAGQPESPEVPAVQESTVDHEKIVKKRADGSSETIERPTLGARKTGPEGTFEWTGERWAKIEDPSLGELTTAELGGGPATPGVPEVLPVMQKTVEEQLQRRAGVPETRTGPMGEYTPEFLEDMLARKEAETSVGPAAMQARLMAMMRETPEQRLNREIEVVKAREAAKAEHGGGNRWAVRNSDRGLVRVNPDTGETEVLIPKTGDPDKPLKGPSDKVIAELSDMKALAAKTMDLARLESDYKYEMAKWTPNIVRNVMAEHTDSEFFDDYQKYDPAYFMYTAAVLKAVQGSRPSDKDMEWYLQNMPRMHDRPEAKAVKVHWLMNELAGKYNNKIAGFAPYRDMSGFPPMIVPPLEKIMKATGAIPKSSELPPGAVLDNP